MDEVARDGMLRSRVVSIIVLGQRGLIWDCEDAIYVRNVRRCTGQVLAKGHSAEFSVQDSAQRDSLLPLILSSAELYAGLRRNWFRVDSLFDEDGRLLFGGVTNERASLALFDELDDTELLKLHVWDDLHQKGMWLSSGVRFGADFLLYPGSPSENHATHVVVCCLTTQELLWTEVMLVQRLATSVRKSVLFAHASPISFDPIRYIELSWMAK